MNSADTVYNRPPQLQKDKKSPFTIREYLKTQQV